MLPFVLIVSAVIYCICYWLWSAAQLQPQNMVDVMHIINGMLFLPSNTIFFLFRGLLLITAAYLLADFVLSAMRRGWKRRQPEEPQELQLKYIHPRKM